MVDVLESFDFVILSEKVLTSLQAIFCHCSVPVAHQSVRLSIRKVLLEREMRATVSEPRPYLVNELYRSLNTQREHTDSSHPRAGQVDIVHNVLHHVQPLTELDVIKELSVVGDSVVPGRSLEEDLACVLPGGGEGQDEDAGLVTPLLFSDHQRVDALNAHVEATRKPWSASDLSCRPSPGVGVELNDGSSPGSVERDEELDMSAEPVVRLLLQEIQTKQSAHAVADDGDWHRARPDEHFLHQQLQSPEVIGLGVGSQSEVVGSRPDGVSSPVAESHKVLDEVVEVVADIPQQPGGPGGVQVLHAVRPPPARDPGLHPGHVAAGPRLPVVEQLDGVGPVPHPATPQLPDVQPQSVPVTTRNPPGFQLVTCS